MRRPRCYLLTLALLLLASGASAAQSRDLARQHKAHARPAQATPVRLAEKPPLPTLSLEAGMGQILTLKTAASNVFVADNKVLEVRPASATSLFVFGVGPGRTTVAALDADGKTVAEYQVTVTPSLFNAAQAQAGLARQMPGRHITVRETPAGLILSGRVDTPEEAAQAVSIAQGFVAEKQTVQNQITVQSSTQVTLRVRIVEMARTVVRNLGVSWTSVGTVGNIGSFWGLGFNVNGATATCSAAGGGIYNPKCLGAGFSATINALAQDGLIRTLAEPNLTVISGQPASFLVGGEYPIPVAQQGGAISIEFKRYGITLSFLPTVMSEGRISIHVAPEVSELSSSGAVTLTAGNSTVSVPALTVRRAETTVELGSGQTFALAGLLQDTSNQSFSNLPYLGDLPILGTLFRSNAYQHAQTELVILVTPIVTKPVDDEAMLHLPTDGFKESTDFEQMFEGRQKAGPTGSPPVRITIPGDAGFIVQ